MAAAFVRSLFSGSAASVKDTMAAIDAACAGSGFSCKTVSWEDAQRATVNGDVSCWGPNISDVRLYEKSGQLLYTVRSENWNERLGYTTTDKVAVVASGNSAAAAPNSMTLRDFLTNFGANGQYAGIDASCNLSDPVLDQRVSMRFQTVFLPSGKSSSSAKATSEFCTEVYNYNTRDDSDPRNVLLLCTPQGVAVQQDGSGAKKLFFHAVDSSNGSVHRYWLEAEESTHKVGAAQIETKDEFEDAARRGKATATFIGTEAMGKRFNVQMLVQVPLKQKTKPTSRGVGCYGYDLCSLESAFSPASVNAYCMSNAALSCESESTSFNSVLDDMGALVQEQGMVLENQCEGRVAKSVPKGVSSAARVSRGTEHDIWHGVSRKDPERDPSQHITITVTLYNIVVGGVPTAEDVKAAIADLDSLYKACDSTSTLATSPVPLPELTVGTMVDISKKVSQQPYTPTIVPAAWATASAAKFPESSSMST